MKTLIKLFAIILLGLLCPIVNAQIENATDNYYNYTVTMDAIFDSIAINQPDTVKVEGLKSYERYKDFWHTRVYNHDSIEGNFTKYTEQLEYYYNNQEMLPREGPITDWEFIGPKNITSHNQGIIVSLYIDPDNINNIYAGGNASGMFHTTDGGQHWVNVTDNIRIPGLGIQDIAVNPNNPAIIYIATGNQLNDYGLGIFKTTDNLQHGKGYCHLIRKSVC